MKKVRKQALSKQGGQYQAVREVIDISQRGRFPQEVESRSSAPGSAKNALMKRTKKCQGHAKQACPRNPIEDGAETLAKTLNLMNLT